MPKKAPVKKEKPVYKDTPKNRRLKRVGKPFGDPRYVEDKDIPAMLLSKKERKAKKAAKQAKQVAYEEEQAAAALRAANAQMAVAEKKVEQNKVGFGRRSGLTPIMRQLLLVRNQSPFERFEIRKVGGVDRIVRMPRLDESGMEIPSGYTPPRNIAERAGTIRGKSYWRKN